MDLLMRSNLTLLGPLRHPRPLSIADIHLELEKEQEAVVCTDKQCITTLSDNLLRGRSTVLPASYPFYVNKPLQ